MRVVIRWLLKLLTLWLVLCIERAIGIPVVSLGLLMIWTQSLQLVPKTIWLLIGTVLMMSLFDVSVVWTWLIVCGGWFWFEKGRVVLPSATLRLLVMVSISAFCLVRLAPGVVDVGIWIYAAVVLAGILLFMKRERLRPTMGWRVR